MSPVKKSVGAGDVRVSNVTGAAPKAPKAPKTAKAPTGKSTETPLQKKPAPFRVEGREPTAAERVAMDLSIRENLATPRGAGESIGTLGEKRMHAILKNYVCRLQPAGVSARPEVRLDGVYPALAGNRSKPVADVLCTDGATVSGPDGETVPAGTVYEIQTGGFFPLREKLARYLEATPCRVVLIHPIAATRYTHWIDPVTGDISPRRRSPKHGDAREVLGELYWIRDLLAADHALGERFTLKLLFLETEEFRLQNGWGNGGKRGATRYERIPLHLLSVMDFESPGDFAAFLPPPEDLPAPFTAAEYGRATGVRGKALYSTLKLLCALGLLVQDGFKGRSMTFRDARGAF